MRRSEATVLAVVLALVTGGFLAAFVELSPTASVGMNRLLVGLFGVAVVALCAGASHRALVPSIFVAVLATGATGWIGAALAICGLLMLADRPDATVRPAMAALAGAGLAAAFVQIADFGRPGLSALLVSGAVGVLVVSALRRASWPVRRAALVAGVGLSAVVVLVVAGAGYEAARAKADMETALDYGYDAAEHLGIGDVDEAVIALERARSRFARAEQRMDGGWANAGRMIPIFGQNLAAVDATAAAAVDVADAGLIVARAGDPRDVVTAGQVNAQRSDELRMAFTAASRTASHGEDHLTGVNDVWLAPPVLREVDRASSQVSALATALRGTADGLDILPALTGANGPRRYLVVIGNPAEARDLGGFAAGFAIVEAVDGSFSLAGSGRPGDAFVDGSMLDGEFPDRYLEMAPWTFGQNLTAVSDLPTMAVAAEQLLADAGAPSIDGVVYLDPFALESLLAFTGPVAVPEYGIVLDHQTTADFFLVDWYERFPEKRTRNRILEAFVAAFVQQFETGVGADDASIEPVVTAIAQQRLAIASLDPAEATVLDDIGVSGRIDSIAAGDDYLAVLHQNAGPNKLDAYVERTVSYRADVDASTGEITAIAEITISNRAPDDLPAYVTANSHGYPDSTSRLIVAVHSPHALVGWTGAEPEPALTRSFWEFGRWRYERAVVVAAGETVRLELALEGFVRPADGYRLQVGHQPLVNADQLEVVVDTGAGLVDHSGPLRRDLDLS